MKKQAFTLIELLIVLSILALMSALVLPTFLKRNPIKDQQQFISEFHGLLFFAWQQSISFSKSHKIVFDMEKKKISLHQETTVSGAKGLEYKPVRITGMSTTVMIPESVVFRRFFIDGFDEMSRFVGGKTTEIWFFISKQGIAQDVSFSLVIQDGQRQQEIWYDIHPFSVQITKRP